MGNCKNCDFWGADGVCSFVDIDYCPVDIFYTNKARPLLSGTNFSIEYTADDDSGLNAQLRTSPNFGCVNFKQKGE